MGLKAMKEPGKPMKVMEAIKVGLLLELGSNEAQPTNRALKDMKAIYAICKKFLVKKRKTRKGRCYFEKSRMLKKSIKR